MSRLIVRLLMVCCLLLMQADAHARVTAIQANGGLPDKYITCISRDRQGLMWIGTRQGLCSYDGYDFTPVATPMAGSTAITMLRYTASDDMLWIATEKGLFRMRCRSRAISPVGNVPQKWAHTAVQSLLSAADGRIYVIYAGGEIATPDHDRLILAGKVPGYHPALIDAGPARNQARQLRVWADEELRYYSLHNDTALQVQPQKTIHIHKPITTEGDTIALETDAKLSFMTERNLSDITPRKLFKDLDLSNVTVVHFNPDGSCYILCRPSKLYLLRFDKNEITQVASDAFIGKLATSMYFDDKLIWVGTNKGLLRMEADDSIFHRELYQLPPISVRPMLRDAASGDFYAGTYHGFYVRKAGSKDWKRLGEMMPYVTASLPGDYIYMAGDPKELQRYNKHTGTLETNFYKSTGLPPDELKGTYAVQYWNDGKLLLGGTYGLAMFDPHTNRVSYVNVTGWPNGMSDVRYISEPKREGYWLCTNKGIYFLDHHHHITWHATMYTRPALSGNNVNYAWQDAEGKVWLCTAGAGINIISADRKQIKVLKAEDGLSDNTTYNLMPDHKGTVWISTFNGLSNYDPASGTFYNYYVTEGLASNECNHNSFIRDDTGAMYAGSIGGLNVFYPERVKRDTTRSRLFASGITKWDNNARAIVVIPAEDTGNVINLQPFDHSLTFSLALSDYSHPENTLFRYRIKELFDEWTPLNSPNTLRLDGLAPGNYTLDIVALDGRGVPASNNLHYLIHVLQPFYKAWWFYLLLFLAASGLAWSFFYVRLRHLRRVQRLREHIASDLHDEVGSLLTRITMTADALLYAGQSEEKRGSGLQKIASLSRSAVSSMSDILWAIDSRNDYTGNLADRMQEHAEEMLWTMNAAVHFDISVTERMSIDSSLRQELYLIFKESINNIVKHSKAKDVRIRYHHDEKGFLLEIVNDGAPGHTAASTGQGLRNMSMRAGRIHAVAIAEHKDDLFTIRVTG